MDFELTEEQKQIKTLIKEFCKREVTEKWVDEYSEKAAKARTVEELRAIYPVDLLEKLHTVGLRQLAVPTKYGGGGAARCGSVTRVIASDQAGYSMGIAARLLGLPWMHCASIDGIHATEEQKDWFFTRFMEDHTMFTALAASEPSGATDIFLPYDGPGALMNTFAYKDGDEWVINGDKMFSSGGGVAGLIRVSARTDKEGPTSQSISQFWVEKDAPGVSYTINNMVSEEIAGNAQIHFDNVRVPESHLVGEINRGALASADLFAAKILLFADELGHAQKIYEHMVEYAKQRVQGGKPIIQHPNIAAFLGEAALILESTRAYIYRAAWENDRREEAGEMMSGFWSNGSMYHCKKMSWRLCEIATEVFGGIGGSVDLPLEKYVRRVFCWLPPGQTPTMEAIKSSMVYNNHKLG